MIYNTHDLRMVLLDVECIFLRNTTENENINMFLFVYHANALYLKDETLLDLYPLTNTMYDTNFRCHDLHQNVIYVNIDKMQNMRVKITEYKVLQNARYTIHLLWLQISWTSLKFLENIHNTLFQCFKNMVHPLYTLLCLSNTEFHCS